MFFFPSSQADRSRALGVFTRSVFQWSSDRQGPPKAVRADDSDQAAEETVSQGTWFGRDAAGVGAPQPSGVSVSVQEWALELQSGRPREPPEKRWAVHHLPHAKQLPSCPIFTSITRSDDPRCVCTEASVLWKCLWAWSAASTSIYLTVIICSKSSERRKNTGWESLSPVELLLKFGAKTGDSNHTWFPSNFDKILILIFVLSMVWPTNQIQIHIYM